MVYVETIEDDHALVFDGPVTYGGLDPKILTSANLADVSGSWELDLLPAKVAERQALQQNSIYTLKRIESHTRPPISERRILDFGSGWGFFLADAKARGWMPCGLEPLPASSVYARATFGLDIVTDTLREDSFPPDSFDAITSFQVFEHLPYPKEDLRRLYKMLRPEGTVLIEVPNFETWTMRILRSKHRHFVQDHLNFFSIATLSRLLADSGFEVIDSFHPTRRMSIRHLVGFSKRYLPAGIADKTQSTLMKTSLWEKIIPMNLRDIIAVIGRKMQ